MDSKFDRFSLAPFIASLWLLLVLVSQSLEASTLVGSLPGDFSVDNKGNANYTIPITVPPGINGMQPSPSIGYSSGSGNGVMGVGWSFNSGFPQSITRGRSLMTRGGVDGINFTADDQLYLDGKLLIRTGGTHGLAGSTYRTEVESFVTIAAEGSGDVIDRFILTDKNGTRMTFGKIGGSSNGYQTGKHLAGGGNAALAYAWWLTRVEDPFGNRCDFIYSTSSQTGETILSEIHYGENTGDSIEHRGKIILVYDENSVQNLGIVRRDRPSRFVGGRRIELNKRLDAISVQFKSDSNFVEESRYELRYEYAPDQGPTRLKGITGKFRPTQGGALQSLPETVFEWSNEELVPGSPDASIQTEAVSLIDDLGKWIERRHVFADFNGNGKTDFLKVTSPVGASYTTFAVRFSDGQGFGPEQITHLPGIPSPHFLKTGDFNGDGMSDIAFGVLNQLSSGILIVHVLLSRGETFLNAQNEGLISINMSDSITDWTGPNGHGMYFSESFSSLASHIVVGDFTGDGRDNILLHGFDSKLSVYGFNHTGGNFTRLWREDVGRNTVFSIGGAFWANSALPGNAYYGERLHPMPLDVNGDGILDYVWMETVNVVSPHPFYPTPGRMFKADLLVAMGKPGGGFKDAVGITYEALFDSSLYREDSLIVMNGDLNGDGKGDLILLTPDRTQGTPQNGEYVYQVRVLLGSGGTNPFVEGSFTPFPTSVQIGSGSTHPWFDKTSKAVALYYGNSSNGNDPDALALRGYGASAPSSDNMMLVDLNNNGLSDFVWFVDPGPDVVADEQNSGWWVMYSLGDHFSAPQKADQFAVVSNLVAGQGALELDYTTQIDNNSGFSLLNARIVSRERTDISGNGLNDWAFSVSQSRLHSSPLVAFSLGTGKRGNKIIGITDGLGRKTEVVYKPLTDDTVYTPGAPVQYPIRESRSAQYVVSDVLKDFGSGTFGSFGSPVYNAGGSKIRDVYHISYHYSGNRVDLSGRGPLGFHSFVTLDRQTNLFKYQFLSQSFPMTGLTKREQTFRAENVQVGPHGKITSFSLHPISSKDNHVVFDTVRSASGGSLTGTVYPFMSRSTELRWEDGSANLIPVADASDPESLFDAYNAAYHGSNGNYTKAHSRIRTDAWFDDQSLAGDPPLSLPTAYDGGMGVPGSQDSITKGFPDWLVSLPTLGLPGHIHYGNLKRTRIVYGDGYETQTTTTYRSPMGVQHAGGGNVVLTGLVETTVTVANAPGYSNTSPVTRYTYQTADKGKPRTQKIETNDSKLDTIQTFHYNNRGQLVETTLADFTSSTHYDIDGGSAFTVSKVDSWDTTRRFPKRTSNSHGHWSEVTLYDAFGRPRTTLDMNGQTTQAVYDGLGRVLSFTDTLRGLSKQTVISATASPGQSPTSEQTVVPPGSVGSAGLTLKSAYYTKETATAQSAVYTHYDRTGRVIRVITEGYGQNDFTVTDTVYNRDGYVVAVSNPYAQGTQANAIPWTITTYDALGRISTVIAPNDTVTSYKYTGRVTQVTADAPDRSAQTQTTLINPKGETIKVWNANNMPSDSQISETAVSTNPSIEFILDGFGRMRQTRTLQEGSNYLTITATYDHLGKQTSLNDPNKGHWTYIYDALGRLRRQQDANGSITTFTYDILSRPLTRTNTAASGGTETASWYYYGLHNENKAHVFHDPGQGWIGAVRRERLQQTGASGLNMNHVTETAYYYDTRGNLYMDLHRIDGKWFYKHRTYDNANRLEKETHFWRPAGIEDEPDSLPYLWQSYGIQYTYNSRSFVTHLHDTQGRIWWEAHATQGYDYLGRPVRFRKGSGYWTTREYDPDTGLVEQIRTGSGWVQNLRFEWDGLGNLKTRKDETEGLSLTETFAYDTLNRLTHRSGMQIAQYADNGNITSKRVLSANGYGGMASFTYGDPAHPHAVTAYADVFNQNFTYDSNGNLLTRDIANRSWALRWAGHDNPRWIIQRTQSMTNTYEGSAFLYGVDRQRIVHFGIDGATASDWDNRTTWLPSRYKSKKLYIGGSMEVDYRNTSTSPVGHTWEMDAVRIYINGPDGRTGEVTFNPEATDVDGHRFLVYHHDHLGSIQTITDFGVSTMGVGPGDTYAREDCSGQRISRFSYDPWGERRDSTDWAGKPNAPFSQGGDCALSSRGFTDHEMMDDLGLVHMNGRIYDPVLGRFLSADPFVPNPSNLQDYNRYSYVRNNPLRFVDPSGFTPKVPDGLEDAREQARRASSQLNRMLGSLGGGVNHPMLGQLTAVSSIIVEIITTAASDNAQTATTRAVEQVNDDTPTPREVDGVLPKDTPPPEDPANPENPGDSAGQAQGGERRTLIIEETLAQHVVTRWDAYEGRRVPVETHEDGRGWTFEDHVRHRVDLANAAAEAAGSPNRIDVEIAFSSTQLNLLVEKHASNSSYVMFLGHGREENGRAVIHFTSGMQQFVPRSEVMGYWRNSGATGQPYSCDWRQLNAFNYLDRMIKMHEGSYKK